MSKHTPNHPQDREEIESLHNRFCDATGDAAMALQDASYLLGRARGRLEANAALLEALQKIASMDYGNQYARGCAEIARAAIAAATGAQAGESHE